MLTAISSATPMEIDSFPTSPRSPTSFKARSSPKARPKPRSRKVRQQWRCSDLTVVSKQNGSVKLVNRLFCHDESCSDSMKFIESLPEYSILAGSWGCGQLGKKTRRSRNLTLVLDLDETLIYSAFEPQDNYDFKITLTDKDGTTDAYVSIRPFAKEFLIEVAKHFEVVLFTAAEKDYAEKIMTVLDPKREYVKYRFYRDSCFNKDDVYIKDLNILGRDIGKILIVDNTLHAFAFQVDNGVLIKSYEGGKTDQALFHLLPALVHIKDAEDVRVALKGVCV